MESSQYWRNRSWLVQTFNVTQEAARWWTYHCTLCDWHLYARDDARRLRLSARLALHLVEHHVDLAELVVG